MGIPNGLVPPTATAGKTPEEKRAAIRAELRKECAAQVPMWTRIDILLERYFDTYTPDQVDVIRALYPCKASLAGYVVTDEGVRPLGAQP